MAAIPATMNCVGIPKPGGPEALVLEQRPVPKPGEGEVLVKVAAAGVNRPDVAQRRGFYPPPPGASDIPGLEIAGEIVALGEGAGRFKVGDAILALVPGGGYAEYCAAHELCALPMPPSLTPREAAGVPETFFTVWHNVFQRGALKSGETLLVHGGSSGIGTTAIQLGKAFGAKVIVTAGSQEKCDACVKLGADRAINYKTEDLSPRPRRLPVAPAPTSSSIWSAATTSSATTRPQRSTDASCRSLSSATPPRPSTSSASC
jgi:NADPH2:quinone reductase